MATGAHAAVAPQERAVGPVRLEDTPTPSPPLPADMRGRGWKQAGGGARAACRETWSAGGGRRGAVPAGSSPRQSFVAQPRPAPPWPLLRRGPGQQLVSDARGSRHREFLNLLNHSSALPPPSPFRFLFYTFFLNICFFLIECRIQSLDV